MSGRGVHFAITPEEMAGLLTAPDDAALMAGIEAIETAWDTENLAETDKAWNAIHRCLTDGSLLYDGGTFPLNHVICGGRNLHKGDDNTVSLITPGQVVDIAAALATITEAELRQRYFSLIDPDDYDGEFGELDFKYTWDWFQVVSALFQRAAVTGRAIVFTVDA